MYNSVVVYCIQYVVDDGGVYNSETGYLYNSGRWCMVYTVLWTMVVCIRGVYNCRIMVMHTVLLQNVESRNVNVT
jgi:hypothetical protein